MPSSKILSRQIVNGKKLKTRNSLTLRVVDGAEITSLMENTVDFNSTNKKKEVFMVREWTKNRRV